MRPGQSPSRLWKLSRWADLGTISEIFDGEAPFAPRGCIAQAWSVAEVLRAWLAYWG
nr:amylo-alpha-1,6-glucosidase [Gloeobacter violaceus]